MLDFNLVNVEAQSQVGKTIEASKKVSINMDIKDYSSFIPLIKQVQSDTSKIVKEFQQYMEKREKKGISLPYNMIKKFEVLKQRLVSTSELLYTQTQFYRSSVGNRELEKQHEQQFYKKVLISYDQRRRWMKQYILKNEGKMQQVEEEVKKCPQYETHSFTQFRNQINFERIEHNYEDKLNLLISNSCLASRNAQLRRKIQNVLNKKGIVHKEGRQANAISDNQKQDRIKINQQKLVSNTSNRTSFTYFYLTKKIQQNEWMAQKLKELKKSNFRLNHAIHSFKNSLQLINKKSAYETLQYNIHHQIILKERKNKIGDGGWVKEFENNKITNTDYLIYLRDTHRKCEQRLKLYGYYFEYSLHNLKFPNKFKCKSTQKIKAKDLNSKMCNILKKKQVNEMMIYKQREQQAIFLSKKKRQQQRRRKMELQKQAQIKKQNQAEDPRLQFFSDLSNINVVIGKEKGSLDESQ